VFGRRWIGMGTAVRRTGSGDEASVSGHTPTEWGPGKGYERIYAGKFRYPCGYRWRESKRAFDAR